ncbi:MAG: hypothetical protein OXN90_04045 [Gemmatimonadota bacterium]|nr:hypothetical protein [Gemmatimonadota bacterium]
MIDFDAKDRKQVKVFRAWYYDPVAIDVKKYSAIAPDPEVRMEKSSSSPAFSLPPDSEEGLVGDNQISEREHFDALDYAHDLTSHLALKEYQSTRGKIIDSIDIDSLLFAGEIKKYNEKEDYVRHPIKLKSDKALRDKAREIVEKSIVAMGGRDALLKIKTMQTKVWIKAHEHVKSLAKPRIVINVGPYYYPVEIWENDKWMGASSKPYNIKVSLDEEVESYHIRDPLESLGKYYSLFRAQLSFKRWHYIDRFLGEGVIIEYIQDEKMNDIEVSTILVDDRKHGDYFLAHFNKKSNLLFSTTQPTGSKAYPIIKTFYRRYTAIENVLTPTEIERIRSARMRISLFLQIAYNGSQSYEDVPQAR